MHKQTLTTNHDMKNKLALLLLTFSLALITTQASAQIQHIEPLNWWVGMKNPNLQLLVHGTNIAETTPSINYAGVRLVKSHKGDSPNYLFLDLVIAKTTKPGTFNIEFKSKGKTLYTQPYTLLAREQDAAKFKGFDASDVVYLIVPDRFANGDPSNDIQANMRETTINRSFDGGRHGGDLRGIINHVDYLADMGFTAIWSTPLLENDMKSYSYHGYAITNHYKVDPRFGTLDDYKALSAKARSRGMKLIFDGVINHSGRNYWWMTDLPFKDWINYPDSMQMTNHRRTVNQDMYASQYDKAAMSKGWFAPSMPDMNGRNPFLANYLIQNSIWWIETLQLGGIRQDTYCYSDKDFSKNWSCNIMTEYPNFNIVGEEWSFNPLVTSYWQRGKKNYDGYVSCLKSVMDFPLQMALTLGLKETEGSDFSKGLTRLYENLANDFVYADPKSVLVMGDNHDMDRILTQFNDDVALNKIALTYLLTTRGIPQLLYGTEVLMTNTGHANNHGVIRSDFPGGWEGDAVDGFTGKGLSTEQSNFQSWLKQLLNWRKQNPVIATGNIVHFAPFDGIYVYFRYNKDKTIMVVINKNDTPINLDTKRFAEILNNKTQATNILTQATYPLTQALPIDAKSATIFEIGTK